jgi:hypothetical protein
MNGRKKIRAASGIFPPGFSHGFFPWVLLAEWVLWAYYNFEFSEN